MQLGGAGGKGNRAATAPRGEEIGCAPTVVQGKAGDVDCFLERAIARLAGFGLHDINQFTVVED